MSSWRLCLHTIPLSNDAKSADWMRAGVRALLVWNPSSRAITVHRPGEITRLTDADELDLSVEVPDFRCRVSDIFD
jgi:Uma2 family endonuclease